MTILASIRHFYKPGKLMMQWYIDARNLGTELIFLSVGAVFWI